MTTWMCISLAWSLLCY